MQKTVLILDDDDAVRESLNDFFADQGWKTIQSKSAEECLVQLIYEVPEGAIIDIRLPMMNGDLLIELIHRRFPALAFIVYTGVTDYLIPLEGKTVFYKPCPDLAIMEEALNRQLEAKYVK